MNNGRLLLLLLLLVTALISPNLPPAAAKAGKYLTILQFIIIPPGIARPCGSSYYHCHQGIEKSIVKIFMLSLRG